MKIGFSPCPNDTYIFYGWVHGKVGKIGCTPHLHDIQTLNETYFPLSKVSMSTAFNRGRDYAILPVGAALGMACGPLVIGKAPLKKVAIPGMGTVAHLLFDLLVKEKCEKVFTTYDQIFSLIESGQVDGGVIIHESRFLFEKRGHELLYDLGALWENSHGVPLPLGALIINRKETRSEELIDILRQSIVYAKEHFSEAFPYIQKWSQEKDREIIEQHIALYVNEETYRLTSQGRKGIETLFEQAKQQGLLHETAALCFCH